MSKNQDQERPGLRERWKDIGAEQFREDMERRHRRATSRGKVSSADMEELWQKRQAQVATVFSRHPVNLGLTLRLCFGGVALLGAALLANASNVALAQGETSAVEHAAVVAALEQDIAGLEIAEDDSAVALEEALEDYLAGARSAGEEVAQLQNDFAEILVEANDQERLDEIGPYPAELAAAAHREELAEHWAPQSLLVDSESAYAINQFDPFSSVEMDPRYAWYSMMEEPGGRNYAGPEDYRWQLVSVMPRFGASPERIDVTWLNRRDDGWLLSWATATYHAEAGVFSGLEVGRTSTGVEYQHWGANHDYDDSFSDIDYADDEDIVTPGQDEDTTEEAQTS